MRVLIATRIYAPEAGAAPQRLAALAQHLADAGHDVTVLTTRPPASVVANVQPHPRIRVRRARVMRDRDGFVRGYLPYLSFDIPLIGRLLVARRPDVIVVEPPPTTGAAARAVGALRRIPVVYYAADILGDAALSAGIAVPVVRAVRLLERAVWRGCAALLAVSGPVAARLRELGVPEDRVHDVGNGIDVTHYGATGERVVRPRPYALYAGTASEVHGAAIFVEAMGAISDGDLVFLGSGTDRDAMRRRAEQLAPARVIFEDTVTPSEAAAWFRGAAVAVASVKPTGGYEFAFPTKLYAAAACGTPIVFTGAGPGEEFAHRAPCGVAVAYDTAAVAAALGDALRVSRDEEARRVQAEWARDEVSIDAVAARITAVLQSVVPNAHPPSSAASARPAARPRGAVRPRRRG